MDAKSHRRRILVIVQVQQAYGRDIIEGVIRYSRQSRRWALYFHTLLPEDQLPDMSGRFDGIIAESRTEVRRRWLQTLEIPRVVISGQHAVPGAGWLVADNYQVGRMAFDHLRDKGFKHFGWCGYERFDYSRQRERGFRDALIENGLDESCLSVFNLAADHADFFAEVPDLLPWLEKLPKPAGVFAVTLDHALHVAQSCREAGIYVPEHIAIIGVNNDPLVAEMSEPPLTSIDHGAREIGYRSAELLEGLMNGKAVPERPIVIPPVGITQRQSTTIFAVNHPEVARALRLIHKHGTEPINITTLLDELPIGRRALESAFVKHLNRTPHEELTRVRMDHARLLLRETDLSLADIAVRCGYRYGSQFSAVFKKHQGMPPRLYRKRHAKTSGA
ncbi:MAG: DNA-binding transcriptional regulator [Phycisphaeraceae bacterium]|nr:DNA-binding transcriptional regulator [Phycisphaeraceae bacterium]